MLKTVFHRNSSFKKFCRFLGLSIRITGLLMVISITAEAQGDLLIMPRRVVFEGSRRSQELNIANTGQDTAKYTISTLQFRMTAGGAFERITEPDSGQYFADKYIRFFPRNIILAPNESQVVKVQLVKTTELPAGEYRSHLYFRAVPIEKPVGEEILKDTSKLSVSISPVFGLTIPVIIRVGETNADVAFSYVYLNMENPSSPALNLTFNRSGNRSVYGEVVVYYCPPAGKETPIQTVRGIAVYTPGKVRNFKITLENIKGVNLHKGKFRIVYSSPPEEGKKMLAETELVLK
ncbi:MAG: molecular chaperone [Bacteroidetes bacterium]|nr:molecular chaperone [Bacteroidota bacterium]